MEFRPIIPWLGGKRRLAKHILPNFPAHQCYVEPFCGGAALFFLKEPSRVEVLNDTKADIVNLYRVVTHHLDEFVQQFRWALVSRQGFDWLRSAHAEGLTDIQRAARFYYLQKSAFGGKVQRQTFGTATTAPPKLNLLRIEEELSQAHLRLSGSYIEHLDWAACVAKYDRPHTLFYLDPPYWGTEGYGVDFSFDQYTQMADLAKTVQGQMLISVNDIPEMREVFAGLPMKRLETRYTCGGKAGRELKGELLIGSPGMVLT
jgi:DNA adenine methylase